MREVLSDMDLVSCLENIKEEVQALEFLNTGQIVFLNLNSFFSYVDDISFTIHGKASDLKCRLSIIEPFIPMSVSEKHLELFMNVASKKNNEMIEDIDMFFDKISKTNFLNSVYQAKTDESWGNILKICRTMRDFYEEESIQAKKTLSSNYFSKLF